MRSLIFLLLLSFNATAALYDRGNGLIYDNVLDITWLQDANYAQTSGYDADGRMDWDASITWAKHLEYGGYDDWRLPSAGNPPPPSFFPMPLSTGEMGHMFYNNLGNAAGFSIQNNVSFTNATYGGGAESFVNAQNSPYWLDEEYGLYEQINTSYVFQTQSGSYMFYPKHYNLYSWPVHDGDIGASAVPLPASFWLFASGLISLRLFKR